MKNKIINIDTHSQLETLTALQLLEGTGLSILDAVRLVKNALDFKPRKAKLSNIQFCSKIIDTGIKHLHIKEMSIAKGFEQYLKTKTYLRKASLDDIKYLGRRLFRTQKYANKNFSELTISDCEKWLAETFPTQSQFNKAHTMLHTLFQYAMRQEWAERNIIKLIARKKIIEKEIVPLTIKQTKVLIETATQPKYKDCLAPLAILAFAGVRPKELTRLKWQDIDLSENTITIRPNTSKTGGTRHIEICKALKKCLKTHLQETHTINENSQIIPTDWKRKWKALRDESGFKNKWIQDVLRHTYASYHTKHYKDFSRLQLNMGHTNQSLLRSRYVNLHNISRLDAKIYFSIAC